MAAAGGGLPAGRCRTAENQKRRPRRRWSWWLIRIILASLGAVKGGHFLVGFAAETERLGEYAARKLRDKQLDLIIANDVSAPGAGFDHDTNIVTAFWPASGEVVEKQYPLLSKKAAAAEIIQLIAKLS